MGWWFGRILTFELIADEEPVTVASVLDELSAGMISASSDDLLKGYAAYGRSIRDAAQPLVDSFAVQVFDDGDRLREARSSVPIAIGEVDFGNSADGEQQPRLQRQQTAIRSLPAVLRLTYYDPARDYQSGEARAVASEQLGVEARQDLAATLDAGAAKTLAQTLIARSWSARNKLTLRLPPGRLALEPGATVRLPISPALWAVDQLTVDAFVVVAEIYPAVGAAAGVAADAGRVVSAPDVVAGPISLALIDVPNLLEPTTAPTVLIAASSAGGTWKSKPVQIEFSGQTITAQTSRTKSVLGTAASLLQPGSTELFDDLNSVDVVLIDTDHWLTSCDDDRLAAGGNLAVVGSELLQFGRVVPLGGGRFRLSHLLRGRGGTEWACGSHEIGEPFCIIAGGTLQPLALPAYAIGATLQVSTLEGVSTSAPFTGSSVRPLSPVNVRAEIDGGGHLQLSWTRRSRQGLAWLDAIDAAIGESAERYSIAVEGWATSLEFTSDHTSATINASDLAGLGAGPATISVRQVGDFGLSRPAQVNITLA